MFFIYTYIYIFTLGKDWPQVPMGRLLRYNRPEWPFFVPALLGALVDGSVMPLCTIALVGAMKGGT